MKKTAVFVAMVSIVLILSSCFKNNNDQTTGEEGTKKLNIGYVGYMGWPNSMDTLNGIQVSIGSINDSGGLDIGGEKYLLNLISYDSNNSQATLTAAVNRLIFEDNVKFIVSDGTLIDAVIPITEANKVVLCTPALSPVILSFKNGRNKPIALLPPPTQATRQSGSLPSFFRICSLASLPITS